MTYLDTNFPYQPDFITPKVWIILSTIVIFVMWVVILCFAPSGYEDLGGKVNDVSETSIGRIRTNTTLERKTEKKVLT